MKRKQKKQSLPKLLAAVCNHEDCPKWLPGHIVDGFNERNESPLLNADYFKFILRAAADVDKCPLCNRLLNGKTTNGMHDLCVKRAEEM